jgi:hypothetical protein
MGSLGMLSFVQMTLVSFGMTYQGMVTAWYVEMQRGGGEGLLGRCQANLVCVLYLFCIGSSARENRNYQA